MLNNSMNRPTLGRLCTVMKRPWKKTDPQETNYTFLNQVAQDLKL